MTFIISPLHKKAPCEDNDTRFYYDKHTFGHEKCNKDTQPEGRYRYPHIFTSVSHISVLPYDTVYARAVKK